MRVLWIGHNLAYPPKGGVLQRNYNLLRQAARNCEVHFLAFDQPATRPPGVMPEDCVHALQEFCTTVNWVPLTFGSGGLKQYCNAFRKLPSRDPFAFAWLKSRTMMGSVKRISGGMSFDVIHFDTLGLSQYRIAVNDAATVLNHHNVESSMMRRRAENARNVLMKLYFSREAHKLRESELHWCNQFDLNLVVSEDEKELLDESMPGIRTKVVANGVDTQYFTPREDPGGTSLLFCGGLSWYPNEGAMKFFFNEIWHLLVQRVPEAVMHVVGRRPPKWLCRLADEDMRINVHGFVEDVRPYFRKATAYVCPIRDGGGTRLKVLDALAMGVPVLATPFACSGLTLEDGKHLLLAETTEGFVMQIERLFADNSLRNKLATNGREVVERIYSWNVIGKNLMGAYEQAAHDKNGRLWTQG